MYYFLYETTNTINNKKYRGAHATDDIDDSYLGSGKALIKAIRKYGKQNFNRQIIKFCASNVDLFEQEQYFVNKEWCLRSDTYNMKPGGKGAPKGSAHHFYGKHYTIAEKVKNGLAIKRAIQGRNWKQTGSRNPNYGKSKSPETVQKMVQSKLNKCYDFCICIKIGINIYKSKNQAAKALGISYQNLDYKLKAGLISYELV